MTISNLRKRVIIILKNLERDMEIEIDIEDCNNYIKKLSEIKDKLYNKGEEWVEEFDELEELDEDDKIYRDDIEHWIYKVQYQLKQILKYLDDDEKKKITSKKGTQKNTRPQITNNIQNNNYIDSINNFIEKWGLKGIIFVVLIVILITVLNHLIQNINLLSFIISLFP